VLERGPTREFVQARLSAAAAVRAAGDRAHLRRFLAFLLGFLCGTGGGYAVWRQTRRTPTTVAAGGIARTFQNIRLFQGMTVIENVLVGLDRHRSNGPNPEAPSARRRRRLLEMAPIVGLVATAVALSLVLRFDGPEAASRLLLALLVLGLLAYVAYVARLGAFSRRDIRYEESAGNRARELLELVGLAAQAPELSRNLSYGDQRRLEIARALATRPRLLLLDEPAAGMNPSEAVELMALIRTIRERGITVLLIEHHMRVVMGISDRIVVFEHGQKIAEGAPQEIRSNARVIEAYLGKEEL
jgi:branched-chain amino acid transport system ATP-binding protein